MQTNCIFIVSSFIIRPHISILSVLKISSFPVLIANKMFHVTVISLVYFCDQFVEPEIHHSRRHSSVCQQSTWHSVTSPNDLYCVEWDVKPYSTTIIFSDGNKILIKTHIYTQKSEYKVTCAEELKSVHLKCNLFAFSSTCAEYLQKI